MIQNKILVIKTLKVSIICYNKYIELNVLFDTDSNNLKLPKKENKEEHQDNENSVKVQNINKNNNTEKENGYYESHSNYYQN